MKKYFFISLVIVYLVAFPAIGQTPPADAVPDPTTVPFWIWAPVFIILLLALLLIRSFSRESQVPH